MNRNQNSFPKSILCLLLALLMLAASSCAPLRISAEEISGNYQRTAQEKGEINDAFRAAAADFSLSLFRNAAAEQRSDLLLSPLSALLCLSMLANGANGETLAQIEQTLGMTVAELNASLYAYTASLPSEKNCRMELANSVWLKTCDSLNIRREFLQANADWYGAQIYEAPFDTSTVKDINNWVRKNTDGQIKKMIEEIDGATVMFLINTLLFDAKWDAPYEKKDIDSGIFHNANGTESRVDMMHSEESVYFRSDSAVGFRRDYQGGKYSFVGILPNRGIALADYIASLNGTEWLRLWNSAQRTPVNVTIPEFTGESDVVLNNALQQMGMTLLFSPDQADLSALGSSANNLYCDLIEQKAVIEVNRNGTKAAAVTWGAMKNAAGYAPLAVTLDRPFLYAIVDNDTGLPLFLGTVSKI